MISSANTHNVESIELKGIKRGTVDTGRVYFVRDLIVTTEQGTLKLALFSDTHSALEVAGVDDVAALSIEE